MSASSLIRAARLHGGLTQTELAHRTGMSQPAIARLERPGANPTAAVLERVLRGAGATLTWASAAGIDETQLRERMRLTPTQRLAAFRASQHNLRAMVRGARARRPS